MMGCLSKMNLFLYSRGLAPGEGEDHLTAFFVAALLLDPDFRRAYEHFVLLPYSQRAGWDEPQIEAVDIQVQLPGGHGSPDMALTLKGGRRVACEHKLEAMETHAFLEDESEDPVPQLARYLRAPDVDALVFVRATLKPPDKEVLDHPKYVRPTERQHFLWRDFYDPLVSSGHPFTAWLREGFEALGFTPPHPLIGDLSSPPDRENFSKLWYRTRQYAHELGWNTNSGDVIELYLRPRDPKPVSELWISPRHERLLIRATPTTGVRVSTLETVFRGVADRLDRYHPHLSIHTREVLRTGGMTPVVEAWAPLRTVLGSVTTGEEAENRLFDFGTPFIEAVSGAR